MRFYKRIFLDLVSNPRIEWMTILYAAADDDDADDVDDGDDQGWW